MCMLSYYPEGIQPEISDLYNGADLNPDGHGFAIVTRDRATGQSRLTIQKSMDAVDLVREFVRLRRNAPDGPAIFHSRIATSGRVDITGCHPFHVGQDTRTVVAHNGILFKPQEAERSDTRVFAEDMLPRMGSLDSQRRIRRIEQFVGKGNKLVILTVNPNRRRNSYLINPEQGVWTKSGAWHSNYDYEGRWWNDEEYLSKGFAYGTTPGGKPKTVTYGNSVFKCDVCGAWDAVSLGDGVCEVCNSCNDCKMHISDCMCYVPHSQRKEAGVLSGRLALPAGGWSENS